MDFAKVYKLLSSVDDQPEETLEEGGTATSKDFALLISHILSGDRPKELVALAEAEGGIEGLEPTLYDEDLMKRREADGWVSKIDIFWLPGKIMVWDPVEDNEFEIFVDEHTKTEIDGEVVTLADLPKEYRFRQKQEV